MFKVKNNRLLIENKNNRLTIQNWLNKKKKSFVMKILFSKL